MTNQEALDLLVATSRAGGFPSSSKTTTGAVMCQYRSPDGRKCAFGVFIPDELYDPRMEGKGAFHVLITCRLLDAVPEALRPPEGEFSGDCRVTHLQQFHDRIAFRQHPITRVDGIDLPDNGGTWNHGLFVTALTSHDRSPFFGMTPTEVA